MTTHIDSDVLLRCHELFLLVGFEIDLPQSVVGVGDDQVVALSVESQAQRTSTDVFLFGIFARLAELGDECDVLAINSDNVAVVQRSEIGFSMSQQAFRTDDFAFEKSLGVVEMIVDLQGA